MDIFDLPKIDGHCHVLDPERFPFSPEVAYRPTGQELGTAAYFAHLMDAYGVRHALLVGPNSGYGTDNRCLLDAIAGAPHRFKGIAVADSGASTESLLALRNGGIVGVAFNPALLGLDHYGDLEPMLGRLAALHMWAQFQVTGDQIVHLRPWLERTGVRTLIDHCGRPLMSDGPDAPGVKALLDLAKGERTVIKLSGFAKFSAQAYPFDDVRPHALRLLEAFGPQRSIWASDWPYLRAPCRLDYGTLLMLALRWFGLDACRQMMWEAPARLFDW